MRLTGQIKKASPSRMPFYQEFKTTPSSYNQRYYNRKFTRTQVLFFVYHSHPLPIRSGSPSPCPLPGRKRGGKPAGFPEKKRPPRPALARRVFLFPVLKRSVLAATSLPRNCQAACLAAAQDKSDERVCKGRPLSFYPLQTRSSDLQALAG